jgi:hypothetical protein
MDQLAQRTRRSLGPSTRQAGQTGEHGVGLLEADSSSSPQ